MALKHLCASSSGHLEEFPGQHFSVVHSFPVSRLAVLEETHLDLEGQSEPPSLIRHLLGQLEQVTNNRTHANDRSFLLTCISKVTNRSRIDGFVVFLRRYHSMGH